MSTFEELQGAHGEDLSGIATVHNESSGGFYSHLPGEYSGIVSKLTVTYKDIEGKKCEKNIPGAKPAFAGLKLIIVKDPEKQLIDNSLNIDFKEDFGRLNYNIYLSLDPEKQWQNVRLLKDFVCNNLPEADIIQGKKNDEDVHIANLPLYYGTPVKWEIIAGKKNADSRYIQNIELLDHQTLTKDLITKRKAVADSINAKLDEHLEKLKEERKAKKDSEGASGHAEESSAIDASSFMDGLGIPSYPANPAASPNDMDY